MRQWSEMTDRKNRQAFRTCFALKPPEPGGDSDGGLWDLEDSLQASDDLSPPIPAETIWKESGKTISYLNRKYDNPQERLLEDLGKGRADVPCDGFQPGHFQADLSAAKHTGRQEFPDLKSAPLLQDSGFGVILPDWWRNRSGRSKLGVKLRFKPSGDKKSGKNAFTLESIVEYDWRLSIGDLEISEEEFNRLSRLKEPLVSIGGKWVVLNREDVDRILKGFQVRQGRRDEPRGGHPAEQRPGRRPWPAGQWLAYAGWIPGIIKNLSSGDRIGKVPAPDQFAGELERLPGQRLLVALVHEKARHRDDTRRRHGPGKTIQLLALLAEEKRTGLVGAYPFALPHVRRRELAAGSGKVRALAEGTFASRYGAG